jgi:hypothetical protein
MRDLLLTAALAYAKGNVDKRIANIEVYLANPAGIGEHSDIIEAIQIELDELAKYDDQIEMINKYFLPET